jgi:hypothetical protein
MIALIVTVVVVSNYLENKRTTAMQQVADTMGLTFQGKANGQTLPLFSGFHLFSQGHGKRIVNLMQGEANDIALKIFDYKYTTGGGKNAQHWTQTVISFWSPALDLPAFSLRPETIFHKIGALFGYQDINFETHPDFSKCYLLRGKQEEAIRALFREEVLLYYEEHRGLSTEGSGPQLVFYRAGKPVKPEDIRAFMEQGFEVLALLGGEKHQ